MAESAKDKALQASTKRLADAEKEFEKRDAGSGAKQTFEDLKERHAALLEAIDKQTIEPLQRSGYSFALLHAAIARRLLAANERLASPENPNAKPIQRIHPKRFEIIIDLNLEYPGGREGARRWVIDHVESAKELAHVHDAGQQIHFEKDRPNSQYVFARLEARAIQALVVLDMEAAKTEAEKRSKATENTATKVQIDPASFARFFTSGRTSRFPRASTSPSRRSKQMRRRTPSQRGALASLGR